MAQAVDSLTTRSIADRSASENCKLAVLMRMALTYADAARVEPDAVKRAELLDLCMTCWRQAQLLRQARLALAPLAGCRRAARSLSKGFFRAMTNSYPL